MTATAVVVAILALYLLVLLAIGVWGGRESGDVKGYYVAGKRLPSWVIAPRGHPERRQSVLRLFRGCVPRQVGLGVAVRQHRLHVCVALAG